VAQSTLLVMASESQLPDVAEPPDRSMPEEIGNNQPRIARE
jgi:hypothetical protein